MDELRRHKRYPVVSLENEDDAEERLSSLYDFPGPNILPEREAERHELEQAVKQALNQLDADRRVVVVLVDLQDLDYQGAAQILGLPIGTVKSRLARARLQLHHLLNT
jgi:RNA polymerase sigma-70 factor (ECF subfamily)